MEIVSPWSVGVNFTTKIATVATPNIVSPANGTTGLPKRPTFTSSGFSIDHSGGGTHASSDWQVSSNTGFTNILVQGSAVTGSNLTSWTPSSDINVETVYVRVRYRSSTGLVSQWSATRTYGIQQMGAGVIVDGNYVLGIFNGNYILVGDNNKRHTGRMWGPIGTGDGVFGTTTNDGVFNTNRMLSITSSDSRVSLWFETEAFQYVRGVHSDGYLPSDEEMTYIYDNRSSLPSGYTDWGTIFWWSSTEFSYHHDISWTRKFSDGARHIYYRADQHGAVQVRRVAV